MSTPAPSRLVRLRRLFLGALGLLCVLLVGWMGLVLPTLQMNKSLPFGMFSAPNGSVCAQDFAYNMLYFRGIQERVVPNPYRLADQEKLIRQLLPVSQQGLSHAYSPVAYVLAQPLLLLSGYQAYLVYIVACALGIFLLFYGDLLPRTQSPLQLYALAICACSLCLVAAFAVGQSALLTTTVLGAFWYLLRRRDFAAGPSFGRDLALAALFWVLCLKPSVAIIPALLLIGAQAWRALVIGAAFLFVTWLCVADRYGGFWTGLADYLYLLNHYHNADFSPFMQRGSETAAQSSWTAHLFAIDRNLILILGTVLVVLRWKKRISLSEHFQGVMGLFLLFSPYLLPSEDWILCLLVVEGAFFNAPLSILSALKLALIIAIMDLREGLTFPFAINYPALCLLFAWIFWELLTSRRNPQPEGVSFQ
jgi:hypothetical protein